MVRPYVSPGLSSVGELRLLMLAAGLIVTGVKQRGRRMNINPKAETVLNGQDVIVMIGSEDDLERFSRDIEIS